MENRNQDNNEEVEWGVPSGPPPKIDLPFTKKRKREIGEWIYDNRETICITVIVYLVIAIGILIGKIIVMPEQETDTVNVEIVDMEEMNRLQEELQRAQELNDMLNSADDRGSVKNAVSNQNATSTQMKEGMSEETRNIFDHSQRVMEDMDRNGEEYQQMLEQIETKRPREASSQKRQDAKVSGNVTVSFSLSNPVRNSMRLDVPAYKCYGGGRVVVNVVVSRNGDVLAASVDRANSSSDNCMNETALDAALNSRFNVDSSAPGRHSGVIIYNFVPQ